MATIGENVLMSTHHHVGHLLGVVGLELAVSIVAPVAFGAAGPALLPYSILGKMALSGVRPGAARAPDLPPLGAGAQPWPPP